MVLFSIFLCFCEFLSRCFFLLTNENKKQAQIGENALQNTL